MLRVLSRERRISRRWWRRRRAIFMRQDRKPPLGTLERYFKYRLTETGVRGNSGPINRLSGRQVRNEADHDHACKLHTRVRRLLARSQKMPHPIHAPAFCSRALRVFPRFYGERVAFAFRHRVEDTARPRDSVNRAELRDRRGNVRSVVITDRILNHTLEFKSALTPARKLIGNTKERASYAL